MEGALGQESGHLLLSIHLDPTGKGAAGLVRGGAG